MKQKVREEYDSSSNELCGSVKVFYNESEHDIKGNLNKKKCSEKATRANGISCARKSTSSDIVPSDKIQLFKKGPGRPALNLAPKQRQERNRKSARACRSRKRLRYQYLEQLVRAKERAVFGLREELEKYKSWCQAIDKGEISNDLIAKFCQDVVSSDDSKTSTRNSSPTSSSDRNTESSIDIKRGRKQERKQATQLQKVLVGSYVRVSSVTTSSSTSLSSPSGTSASSSTSMSQSPTDATEEEDAELRQQRVNHGLQAKNIPGQVVNESSVIPDIKRRFSQRNQTLSDSKVPMPFKQKSTTFSSNHIIVGDSKNGGQVSRESQKCKGSRPSFAEEVYTRHLDTHLTEKPESSSTSSTSKQISASTPSTEKPIISSTSSSDRELMKWILENEEDILSGSAWTAVSESSTATHGPVSQLSPYITGDFNSHSQTNIDSRRKDITEAYSFSQTHMEYQFPISHSLQDKTDSTLSRQTHESLNMALKFRSDSQHQNQPFITEIATHAKHSAPSQPSCEFNHFKNARNSTEFVSNNMYVQDRVCLRESQRTSDFSVQCNSQKQSHLSTSDVRYTIDFEKPPENHLCTVNQTEVFEEQNHHNFPRFSSSTTVQDLSSQDMEFDYHNQSAYKFQRSTSFPYGDQSFQFNNSTPRHFYSSYFQGSDNMMPGFTDTLFNVTTTVSISRARDFAPATFRNTGLQEHSEEHQNFHRLLQRSNSQPEGQHRWYQHINDF